MPFEIFREDTFRRDIIDEWFKEHIDEKFKPLIRQVEQKKKQ